MSKLFTLIKQGMESPERILPYLRRRVQRKFSKRVLNIYRNPSIYLNSKLGIGTNIFNREWEVLVVLDTCRIDSLRQLQAEYTFLDDIETIWSVGSHSSEWIANTFDTKYKDILSKTAYISSNPHLKMVLLDKFESELTDDAERVKTYGRHNIVSPKDIGKYEDLSTYSGEDYDFCPPRYVIDRGISIARSSEFDRLVLHYMPPHMPYLNRTIPSDSDLSTYDGNIFSYIAETGDKESVFKAHKNMLRWVLNEVELLRKNIDARIAITSDHGDALGEYGVLNHRAGSLHPYVKRVPWTMTAGVDSGSYEPKFSNEQDETTNSTKETLEALGYV